MWLEKFLAEPKVVRINDAFCETNDYIEKEFFQDFTKGDEKRLAGSFSDLIVVCAILKLHQL